METHYSLRYSVYESVCSVKMQALPPRTKDRWLGVAETILHELTFLQRRVFRSKLHSFLFWTYNL